MYRASVNNQDRTNILNIENPVNELHEQMGEGVGKYLPSWLDDTSVGLLKVVLCPVLSKKIVIHLGILVVFFLFLKNGCWSEF